jgi:hypothetical protein
MAGPMHDLKLVVHFLKNWEKWLSVLFAEAWNYRPVSENPADALQWKWEDQFLDEYILL